MTPDRTPATREFGHYRVGDAVVSISLVDAPLRFEAWLAALLISLREEGGSPTNGVVISTHRHDRNHPRRTVSITVDGNHVADGSDPTLAIESLFARLDRLAFDSQPALLHLHAGCAVDGAGHAVLVVGASGAGKSTLIARMCADGWGHVTDEVVGIHSDARVSGHRRPVVLKEGGPLLPTVAMFEAVSDALEDPTEGYRRIRTWWKLRELLGHISARYAAPPDPLSGSARFVSPGSLAPPSAPGPWAPTVIAFCERAPGARQQVERIGPAEAVTRLVEQCFDADRFGPYFTELLLRLALTATSVVARYDDGAQLPTALAAVAADPPAMRSAQLLPLPAGAGIARATSTRSWRVDDEVLVVDDTSGVVLALSGTGATIWESLDGSMDRKGLVAALAVQFAVPLSGVADDVSRLLALLHDQRLIHGLR